MSLQVEKLENNKAKLKIEVAAADFDKAVEKAYQKQKGHMAVPGFRKGKVPRAMIEKMYGVEIFFEEATNILIPDAYAKAYDESGLEIVSQPVIDIEQIGKGQDFIFTAEVDLKPEVTLGDYKGVSIEKIEEEVTAQEVEEEIKKSLEKHARVITVEDRGVENGDDIIFDFDGSVDGVQFLGGQAENYALTIGSGSFIPGFEEQLVGAKLEEAMEVKVTFPEEYHVDDLKGKEAVFKCVVHEIKAKELPELDDEFASEVSEFDTVAEYKADVEEKLKETKANVAKREKENQAVQAAVENAKMDIPDGMIEMQIKQMINDFSQKMKQQGLTVEQYLEFTGMTVDKMKADMKPSAIERIQTRLVLEAVVEAEKIEISEEKLDEQLATMAQAYQMEVEKLKEFMGQTEKDQMKKDMAVQAAAALITDAAVVK